MCKKLRSVELELRASEGETKVTMSISQSELAFIEKLAAHVNRVSRSALEPTIIVTPTSEPSMYNYEIQKEKLFTDEGQRLFLKVRDNILKKLSISGAIVLSQAIEIPESVGCVESWDLLACVDRMIELREIYEVTLEGSSKRIFAKVG